MELNEMKKALIIIALLLLTLSTIATAQDWPQSYYDSAMSMNSPQTVISKDNVFVAC